MLPYLVSTDVILVKDKGTKTSCARDFSAVLQKLVLSMSDEIRFEIIAEILHKLPQLRTFWYIAFICDNYDGKEYQDGQVWEQLIRTYLPNLIDFRLHVGLERERGVGPSNIIQSFCTSFWIEKKKWWFVADQPDNNADTIELYSLPPPVNCKIIFRTNVQWASNSSNPNFKSVRTLGLLPTSNRSMSSVPNTRYFPNVTTIRSASSYGFDFFFDISILSACIDLTKIKNCVIVNRDLIKALPAMTNLTTMEIRHVSADIEDFKKNYSSIPTLKKLSLGTYSSDYGCDQNDLTIITSLFSNLEHIQLSIGELESLNILFAKLSHLIYATIYYKIEVINRQHLEQWLNDHEAIIKFTWSIDDDRLDIWMD
ncbi:unnamed protein product [Adineta steineri]|uniref:Uncharacterized protein n=1 Tax=Adineta steineri TaxID=433720 RepID=A0A815PI86_9BILA|nr:unnamed protein product [Adineta steineri]CAF1449582.1 unnamed protein product [Adineta steineri]